MNTDNVWIVVVLVVGIVILANLAMFAMVRGSRGVKTNWLQNLGGFAGRPFEKEDKSLDELHDRVQDLQNDDKKK
jgi:hypothetical protein